MTAVQRRPRWQLATSLALTATLLLVGVLSGGVRGIREPIAMLPVLGAVGILVVAVLADAAEARRVRDLLRSPVGLALSGFAVCYLLSALGGLRPTNNLGTSAAMLLGLGFALTTAWWARDAARRRTLVVLFVLGSIGATTPALFQGGQVDVAYGGAVVSNRASGSFVDPNELGVYSAIALVAAITLAGMGRARGRTRALALVAVASASGGLVLSYSRGSWVAFAAGLAVMVTLAPLRRVVFWLVPAGAASVTAAWAAGFPLPVATAAERLSTLMSGGSKNPDDYRPQIWHEAWTHGWDHPWFGYGPGAFRSLSADPDVSALWSKPVRHAHSGLLNTFVENGLPAALLAATASVALLVMLLRRVNQVGPMQARLTTGTLAVLVVAGVHLTTDYALRNLAVMTTVWFWVGLGWGQVVPARERDEGLAREPAPPAVPLPAPAPRTSRLAPSLGGAALSGLGAAVSAGTNLLLVVVVARGLGVAATGVFSVCLAVGLFSLAISKWGLDTAVIHVVPRLGGLGGFGQLRSLVLTTVTRTAVLGVAIALALQGSAPWLADRLLSDTGGELAPALVAVAWSVPAAAPSLVLLSVLRARQSLRPLVVWDQVAKPVLRLVVVAGAIALGGDVVVAVWAWALVQWVVLAGSLWEARAVLAHGGRPMSLTLRRQLGRYSRQRWASSILEMAGMHVGILVIAVLGTATQAGQLSVATRVASAGLLALQAARLALAPQISAALARQDRRAAERLHLVSTSWVVLVAGPAYVVLGLGAPDVMAWFGAELRSSWPLLSVLAAAGLVSVVAGNVQTVLLMSGRSGAYLAVAVASVAVNATVALALVAPLGVLGVALGAATATVLENLVIAWLVTRHVGVRAFGAPVTTSLRLVAVFLVVFLAGSRLVPGLPGVVVAAVVGGGLLVELAWRSRTAFRAPEHDVPLPGPAPRPIGVLA
jgi:O-antigen/teichoic acid export membrane protein/O-antigen ligase